jgi:hypothetical protein
MQDFHPGNTGLGGNPRHVTREWPCSLSSTMNLLKLMAGRRPVVNVHTPAGKPSLDVQCKHHLDVVFVIFPSFTSFHDRNME